MRAVMEARIPRKRKVEMNWHWDWEADVIDHIQNPVSFIKVKRKHAKRCAVTLNARNAN